jgi:hypothetical protein
MTIGLLFSRMIADYGTPEEADLMSGAVYMHASITEDKCSQVSSYSSAVPDPEWIQIQLGQASGQYVWYRIWIRVDLRCQNWPKNKRKKVWETPCFAKSVFSLDGWRLSLESSNPSWRPNINTLQFVILKKLPEENFFSLKSVLRIRIQGMVLFWSLDPGSGLSFFRIADPGSWSLHPGSLI